MSETKFTPGPWCIIEDDYFDNSIVIGRRTKQCGYYHCATAEDVEDDSEKFANARLIAAAPDMYEALRRISMAKPDRLDHSLDVTIIQRCANVAIAALAKARGRS